jgi:CMP-N-acetylneuraminic acid synthetase
MIVGLIPARGGSKGIPRKNLQEIEGKSLLQRGIESLKESQCEKVYVSTEDLEIAALALEHGAEVVVRPLELAQDDTSTEAVIMQAIAYLSLNSDDILVVHQVTSPLVKLDSIQMCIGAVANNPSINSSLTLRDGVPFVWLESTEGLWNPKNHERNYRPLRQEFGPQGIETGGIYVMRVSALIDQKNRFPHPTLGVKVSYLESLDIDSIEELSEARQIFKCLNSFYR